MKHLVINFFAFEAGWTACVLGAASGRGWAGAGLALVLVATHVPPFRQACWYQGKTTDDNWAPFFVCGQVGEVLLRCSAARPDCQFTVLCGHTHNEGIANIADNLVVYTGAADYGNPDIEAVIEIDPSDSTMAVKRVR